MRNLTLSGMVSLLAVTVFPVFAADTEPAPGQKIRPPTAQAAGFTPGNVGKPQFRVGGATREPQVTVAGEGAHENPADSGIPMRLPAKEGSSEKR